MLATAAAAKAAVANGLPPIEPLRSTSKQIAVAGRTQPRTRKRSASMRLRDPSTIASRLASKSRSPPSGRYGNVCSLPTPGARACPPRAMSTKMLPAIRFANSRNLASVAPTKSASSASVSSGESRSPSATAASSRSPTSGEICSKRGSRANWRRDVVRRCCCPISASASAPSRTCLSLTVGFSEASERPPPGPSLFPSRALGRRPTAKVR